MTDATLSTDTGQHDLHILSLIHLFIQPFIHEEVIQNNDKEQLTFVRTSIKHFLFFFFFFLAFSFLMLILTPGGKTSVN